MRITKGVGLSRPGDQSVVLHPARGAAFEAAREKHLRVGLACTAPAGDEGDGVQQNDSEQLGELKQPGGRSEGAGHSLSLGDEGEVVGGGVEL